MVSIPIPVEQHRPQALQTSHHAAWNGTGCTLSLPCIAFKSFRSAASTIPGIELVHIVRKGQFRPELRPFQQFCQLAA